MDKLYEEAVQTKEDTIINALIATETMEGINCSTVFEIPKKELKDILKKYNRTEQ